MGGGEREREKKEKKKRRGACFYVPQASMHA
jgi:hypothetical protein